MSPSAALRAAVLGSPIGHSKSPALHRAAYRFLGLDIGYSRVQLAEDGVSEFLHGPGAEPGWLGWSVTMPLKAALITAMDEVSERVMTLGALNTVIHEHDDDGVRSLRGENTDVDGIVAALSEAGVEGSGGERSFAVIGAGGTAAAALAAGKELGFGIAVVYVRSTARAAALVPIAEQLGLALELRALDTLIPELHAAQRPPVLISTLPPRAADPLAEGLPALQDRALLLDVAYDPWPSALALGWEAAGGVVVSGALMLLHQAVKQVELFTAQTQNPAGRLSVSDHRQLVATMRSALKPA